MERNPRRLASEHLDLLVIGGGIFGACAVWEASRRGLKAGLIERVDFGHATSANSLKTIHGGLRYLSRGELRTMAQFAREQRTFLRLAPHLVHPIEFVAPFVHTPRLLAQFIRSGAKAHQLITGNGVLPPAEWLPASELIAAHPALGLEQVSGALAWHDAQVYDTERLTLAFIATAVRDGAQVANYLEAEDLIAERGQVTGVHARDLLSGDRLRIRTSAVVNAAGPWIGRVLGRELPIRYRKAINILVPRVPGGQALGLESANNGRLFFVPWRDVTMIGTAYVNAEMSPDRLHAKEGEIEALLATAVNSLPSAELTGTDVMMVHCGLVPTESGNGRKGTYPVIDHREDGCSGVYSVIGSKYTMARMAAEKVTDRVFTGLGYRPAKPGAADNRPLLGGDIENVSAFLDQANMDRPAGVDGATLQDLVYSYGTEYRRVIADDRQGSHSADAWRVLRSRIRYAVKHEMAHTLPDVVFRRTGLGSAGRPAGEALQVAATTMAELCGWDTAATADQIAAVERRFAWA